MKTTELPSKYWHVRSITDLGRDSHTCEACREKTVRFVIRLMHAWHDRVPGVGKCCALRMTNEKNLILAGERLLVERARKRDKWLNHGWKLSRAGNFTRFDDGIVTIFRDSKKEGNWKYVISTPDGPKYGPSFGSETLARAACFDKLYPPSVEPADRLHLAADPAWEER